MVSPIGPVQVQSLNPAGLAARTADATEASGGGFVDAVGDALSEVAQRESTAKQAAEAAAVGDLQSVSDYMIAATEAQLATEITVAVRDRAVNAFNDIMRMQI